MNKYRNELKQIEHDFQELKDTYDLNKEILNKQLNKLQEKCPHKSTFWFNTDIDSDGSRTEETEICDDCKKHLKYRWV